jgi:hypothetical protein
MSLFTMAVGGGEGKPPDGVGDGLAEGDGDACGVGEADGVGDGVGVGEGCGLGEGVGLLVTTVNETVC